MAGVLFSMQRLTQRITQLLTQRLPQRLPQPFTGAVNNMRGMYLCYFLALGSFLPFITLYYERLGLTGIEIGALAAIPVVVLSSTALVWGALSDAFRLHKWILSLALLLSPIAVLLMARANEVLALAGLTAAYALFSSPILPLLDSLALEVAALQKGTFGGLRVWGSVGWAASTLWIGSLIERFEIRLFFYGYAAFMALAFLLSLHQPARISRLTSPMRSEVRTFFRPDILIFLASVFLLATTVGATNAFYSIYMDGIGAGEGSIGLGWALAAVSEIPVMIFSGEIIRRIGAGGLLKVAFLVYALRWLLVSFIQDPRLAVGVQVLHGISFAPLIIGGVIYIHNWVPDSLGATAQAAFNTVLFGVGAMVGSLMGGLLYDLAGMAALFRVLSVVALAGFVLFGLSSRAGKRSGES